MKNEAINSKYSDLTSELMKTLNESKIDSNEPSPSLVKATPPPAIVVVDEDDTPSLKDEPDVDYNEKTPREQLKEELDEKLEEIGKAVII